MAVIYEIPFLGDAEVAHRHVEFLRREELRQLLVRPAVEFSLVPFTVGVFGGIEAALGMGHVAQDIAENVAHHFGVPRVAADEVGIQIELRELRVVVEHFLEVRHEPVRVHGVTREAAAELIVDAARRHLVASMQNHPRGFVVVETFRVA